MNYEKYISEAVNLAVNKNLLSSKLPIVSEPYYRFLYYMANLAFSHIIELGVYKGVSLAYLLEGDMVTDYPLSTIIGVDLDCSQIPMSIKNDQRAILFEMDSVDFLGGLADKTLHQPLFYLDTLHTPEHVQAELDEIVRVSIQPVVCIDDISIDLEMANWWTDLKLSSPKKQYKISLPSLHSTGYGVLVL